ncbi:MAG: hypothetical protein VX916_02475, partial [Planctomycetota bacterium]|nr:hypothetical protein [Planctomycetota bacterium]
MKSKARLWPTLVACLIASTPTSAQEPPPPQETTIRSSEPLFGFLEDGQAVLVFLNGVEVIQSNRRLTGKTLVLVLAERQDNPPPAPAGGDLLVENSRIQEIYLEGNVSIEEGDERILGASLFYADNRSGTAWVKEGESRSTGSSGPLVIRFDQMRKLADGTRSLEGLKYTTCDYQHLHWYVSTPLATITPSPKGDILQTSDNTVRVAGVPVFWWPGLKVNLDDHDLLLKKISLGDSSRLGSELGTVWGGNADNLATSLGVALGHNEPVKGSWEVQADLYGKRGLFLEPSFEYHGPEMKGSALFSFINDSASTDHLDQVIGDGTRGRLRMQHRSWLNRKDFDDFTLVDLEVSYLSDRNYLNEYYEREFKAGKGQETYVRYESVHEDEAITVLARGRLNDFDTQVQYYPEIQRRISARPTTKPWLFGGLLTVRDILSQAHLAPDEDQPTVSSERNFRAGRRVQVD